jgi:cysteinyl-tRNA synthetase
MSKLQFYNTLTNKVEPFNPITPGHVLMYNCGPTVYNYAHIGNLSSYLMADLIRRYLEYRGYKVKQVMNITDVGHLVDDDIGEGEDKMEKAAREQEKDIWQIARDYEESFHNDRKKLHILDAHEYPRATEWAKQQLEAVMQLLEKGFAYEISDGMYFDIKKFPNYGKLSGNKVEDLDEGARVGVNTEKHHPYDFALWKKCVGENANHSMRWSNSTGEKLNGIKADPAAGFPGWHIECSTMSSQLLGEQIDIHTGGEDNIFPHHECEIAQAESLSDKKFCNMWIHKRHVFVDGKKMSKSKHNFYTISDLEAKGHSPLAYRYLILSTHYRQNTNFTFKSLGDAQKNIDRLQSFLEAVQEASDEGHTVDVRNTRMIFEEAMNDDLNVSAALAAVFDLVRDGYRALQSGGIKDRLDVLKFLKDVDSVFAVLSWDVEPEEDPQIEILICKRNELRSSGKFEEADKIRDHLSEQGIELEDKDGKTNWKRVEKYQVSTRPRL